MKLMLSLMMMMSMTFTQIKHPMAMGCLLLMQTIAVSMMSGMLSQTFWFSYILFLIFLGGMLVLFIYVTSITSNKMFNMSTKLIMIIPTMSIMLTLYMYMDINNQESINFLLLNNNTTNTLLKLYNNYTNYITIMMASYLFITLITIVKITNIFKGPLRKMK
uniref:NADH dehydrogenase subunit 6 n=1 Tax=Allacta robusta TaxID=3037031 RepID=UPI0027A889FB|nr:NADH dehydrogenase subunit 6 [Allacta robusta]WGO57012.1 NADH dehydrogenase subunit 6 [Allacta robusta]